MICAFSTTLLDNSTLLLGKFNMSTVSGQGNEREGKCGVK